jgi:quinolinate synthase
MAKLFTRGGEEMTVISPERTDQRIKALQAEILELKEKKKAIILAHNYQVPEVQDIADFVGDSLDLSRRAKETDARIIVFCGVHFMAETASILSPDKKVLIPDREAGCSLADSITPEDLNAWKKQHPDAVVVSYINTTAEVKALSDYCCTSSNAVKVIQAIPEDKEILFLPDMFLGAYVSKVTGRNIKIWPGECHVHAKIRLEDIDRMRELYPDAEFLIHPECGCSTSCMFYASDGLLKKTRTFILSTGGMVRRSRESNAQNFIVATETGLIYRLEKENPQKNFIPANPEAICQYMKLITLEKVLHSLKEEVYEVKVDEEIARRARRAIERMLSIT